jgi:type II secretory pathway pseudopilin PulG
MWRSSRSNRCGPARGFTLLEAMVSLLLLVIVLIVAMTMLFQMRAFAERQQYFMLPRQAARRAADYLSFYFAGASDANYVDSTRPSPNALIMYYNLGAAGVLTQASYNNLTGLEPGNNTRTVPANPPLIPVDIPSTNFGDIGTDIITMVTPFSPARYQVLKPFPALSANADLWLNFRVGCGSTNDDVANQAAFAAATGFDGTQSALLMLVDDSGSWSYVRIPSLASYQGDGLCSDVTAFKNIHIKVDTTSAALAPPNGGAPLTDLVYLVTGLQVISFRVLTDSVDGLPKLQQKLGLFDPSTDNPGTAFTNVMENVEDLQVAYMYSQNLAAGTGDNPLVWNTKSQTIGGDHVPLQAGPSGAPTPLDITNVIGVRVSVTGRSPLLPLAAQKMTDVKPLASAASTHFRPASEDHFVADPPQYDKFDHYRATATLLLRNRIPRG